MSRIEKFKAAQAKLNAEVEELLKIEEPTTEHVEKAKELNARSEELREMIKTMEALETESKAMKEEYSKLERTVPVMTTENVENSNEWFGKYLRTGMKTKAARESAPEDGGVLVPVDFRDELLQRLRKENPLLSRVSRMSTSRNQLEMPTFDHDATVSKLAEGGSITEDDVAGAFGMKRFLLKKYSVMHKFSEELMNDSVFNVEQILADHMVARILEQLELDLINGSGAGNGPLGLLNDTLTATAISNASITYAKLVDTVYGLDPQYRRNGVWLVNKTALASMRKLESTGGDLIWADGAAGQPPSFLGYPVIELDETVLAAASSSGDAFVLFGDPSKIMLVEQPNIDIKRDVDFEEDLVKIKANYRCDAQLIDSRAFIRFNKA